MFPTTSYIICVVHVIMLVLNGIIEIVATPEWTVFVVNAGCHIRCSVDAGFVSTLSDVASGGFLVV